MEDAFRAEFIEELRAGGALRICRVACARIEFNCAGKAKTSERGEDSARREKERERERLRSEYIATLLQLLLEKKRGMKSRRR